MDERLDWSVTVTGKTSADADPHTVWQDVASMMKLEPAEFRQRIFDRVPLSLKPVSELEAIRQRDALIRHGAEAVALANPGGRHLWLQLDGEVRGAVSEAFARHAIEHGVLDPQARGCIKGEQTWQSLDAALGLLPAMAGKTDSAPEPASPEAPRDTVRVAPPDLHRAEAGAIHLDAVEPLHAAQRGDEALPEDTAGLYAGFWMRVAAYFIDGAVVWAAVIVLLLPFGLAHPYATAAQRPNPLLVVVLALAIIALGWLYFPLWESSSKQATPGKLALGLRVTGQDGERIGFGRAFGRFIGKLVSGFILYVGFMMAGWTRRKQALHDLMAGTLVVHRDGLQAWRRGDDTLARAKMPRWAIAVIIVGCGFFVIVPVLAAIAIPAYQSYLLRAQTSEAIVVAEPARVAVSQYLLATNGTAPRDNAQAGLKSPDTLHDRYVSSVTVYNGAVTAEFGNLTNLLLRGKHITFTPAWRDHHVAWRCSSYDIDSRYLPLTCR